MITELGIPDLSTPINGTLGMCGDQRNSYQKYKAPAYAINKGTIITIATSEVNWFLKKNIAQ